MSIKTEKKFEQAIIKTVAFFDLFDYPLTPGEIWQWSQWPDSGINLAEVLQALESKEMRDLLERKNGFHFLSGRESIVRTRLKRYNYSNRKFKRTLWVAGLFKIIPWIKLVAVSNIIGNHNLKDESDIDIFIVAERDRVWITRLFCTGFMKILNLRPREGKERDKICLNFYVTKESLDLSKLRLNDDIYFIYWLACLMPIYDRDNTFHKLIRANPWLKNYLLYWQPAKLVSRLNAGKPWPQTYYDIVDLFMGGLEQVVKIIQLKIMPPSLKSIMNKDTRVVVSDNIIKLYAKDRREEYGRKWREKILQIQNRDKNRKEILKLASL